jgi:RND family efflux transporter MFP subunit
MRTYLARIARMAVTLALLVGAGFAAVPVWDYYMNAPWTRDGRVAADVVGVAPDVSGLINDVDVDDNQVVRRGDVLFRIDSARFELALKLAEAVVAERQADMAEAGREAVRYGRLTDLSVSEEKQQQRGSVAARAAALYQQAVLDRDVAALNLQRSVVRSPVDGTVTNFDVRPGDYASAGHVVLAVIDSATLRVEGYFEETKLHAIHVGDPASVRLMGSRVVLHGRVQSMAAGVEDRDRTGGELLANINPTFSWVRLAQRIPVRVVFDHLPPDAGLVVGRTATVAINMPAPR